jgi:hypothetical protein
MPWRNPTMGPISESASNAAWMMPRSDRLMTAVGPPDWPTTSALLLDDASDLPFP